MRKVCMFLSVLVLGLSLVASGAEPKSRPVKEPKYGSKNARYFRVVFGKEGKASMLGVIDESQGTGKGYDRAYVDENRDNDLTNEKAKEFPRMRRGSSGQSMVDPRFDFKGPLKKGQDGEYTLNIYVLRSPGRVPKPGEKLSFFWYLKTEGWNFFFINGQMQLHSSAAEALKGEPVRLGGKCAWEIGSSVRNKQVLVSAGLKDENGCTLRIVNAPSGNPSPQLTLMKGGARVKEAKMSFG